MPKIPDMPSFNFKLGGAQLSGPRTECRRLAVQGAQTGKYFEYPDIQKVAGSKTDELYCSAEFKQRTLIRISACVGVGIYSLRLHFDDGTQSPVLGSRHELTSELLIGED